MSGNHGLALGSLDLTMIVLSNLGHVCCHVFFANSYIQNTVENLINGYKHLSQIPVRDNSWPSVDIMVSVGSEVFKDRAINLSAFLTVKQNRLFNCNFEQTCSHEPRTG